MTRFRFILLKEKASRLLKRGVEEEIIVNFISNLEVRNQAFNSVQTVGEKINVLNQVQQLWSDFLYTATPQVLRYEAGENK